MPYIEIVEKDETTPGTLAEQTDVVYIPGFVDVTQKCLHNTDGEYIGILPNVPTLFTSVKQFESLCGTRAATFTEKQLYTDLQENLPEGGYSGFSAYAIPYHKVMFEAGMSDPSYIMAKEYLNAGLNVLFERINADGEYVEVTEEPANWKDVYGNYYGNVNSSESDYFSLITDTTPPLWYDKVDIGDEVISGVDYYEATYKVVNEKTTSIITAFTKVNGLAVGTKITVDNYYKPNGKTYYKADDYVELTGDKEAILVNTGEYYRLEDDKYILLTTEELQEYLTNEETIYIPNYKNISFDTNGNMLPAPEDWVHTYNKHYEISEVTIKLDQLFTFVPFNEIINAGIKITKFSDGINIKNMYRALESIYDSSNIDGLADKGNYSIKYLTSGGYPVYEYTNNIIVTRMLDLAEARGDCVAFIDHTDNVHRENNIDTRGSVYHSVKNDEVFATKGDFGTMFTPWALYNRTTTDKDEDGKTIKGGSVRMPGSYAYFNALGDSIQTNANWLAIAGSARGVVPNLATDGMTTNIPNGAADAMQPRDDVAVNAITNIKPYGWTIWGNRTLKNNAENGNLTATSFLNTRNLISDVKKTAYRVARKLTFEQNNDILWVNFKGLISPTLDRMLSGYGISGYKIVRDTEHEKASEKATVCAKIILYPVYAVEDFYITIVLKDDEVNVE